MVLDGLKAYGSCFLILAYHWLVGKIMYFLVDEDIELLAITFPVAVVIASIMIARACFGKIETYQSVKGVYILGGIYTIANSGLLIFFYYAYYA